MEPVRATIFGRSSAEGRGSLSRAEAHHLLGGRELRRRRRARRRCRRPCAPRRGRARRPRRSVTRRPRARKPRIAASSQTSVATPKTTISSGSSASSSGSVFGFVKTSKFFFSSRNSRPRDSHGIRPGGTDERAAPGRPAASRRSSPRRACRGGSAADTCLRKSGVVRDLGVGQLVVVGRGDVRRCRAARAAVDEPRHRRHAPSSASGTASLPSASHEVDLRVDVPEERASRDELEPRVRPQRRPTFADGSPSVMTMSPVKSFEPRISDEPTPYASTGTPLLLERRGSCRP